MDQDQTERLARAGNALRPDWPVASLRTFLAKNFTNRPWRDVALVLAVVATDPATDTPRLMLEDWPWQVTRPLAPSDAARHTSSVPWTALCDHCGRDETHCQSAEVQAEDPHAYTTLAIRRAAEEHRRKSTATAPGRPYMPAWFREQAAHDIAVGAAALAADAAQHTKKADQ